MNSLGLLGQRRFGPIFWTQFFGAFNDNLFKNALVLLVAFKVTSEAESGILVNLAAGLFILPFFLFSPLAGQLSDKYDKTRIIRFTKVAELVIMALGGIGLVLGNIPYLLVILFLMGSHSAFFGPAKYSILPQHLHSDELTAGNGLVEMGTFLAILLGTSTAGVLMQYGVQPVTVGVILLAVLGVATTMLIPSAPATDPTLKINWNPFTETMNLARIASKPQSVFLSIMGISWYWFFGATVLAQLPNFTKYCLHGHESVVTFLLAIFSLSVGLGAGLCTYLSRSDVELGLVPIGALGLSLFAADLFLLDYGVAPTELRTIAGLFADRDVLPIFRILFDLSALGVAGSLFIVPLYAMVQHRAEERVMSRVIAANNVFNGVFMVASAVTTMLLYRAGLTTVGIFAVLAATNLAVATYVFAQVPEFALRFGLWILASTIYDLRYKGRDHFPRHGAALIVANHVSFIDWLIITAACRRPVRFVMDHRIFATPVLGFVFRLCKAIPIAPAKEDAAIKEAAFARISEALRDDQVVCIFPEGGITRDGNIMPFRSGVERILARDQVPVIPMALVGLWGSFFSRKSGSAMGTMPKPSRRTIECHIGEPLGGAPSAADLEHAVRSLADEPALSSRRSA